MNPSDDVLDAIARVLELDDTERVHLHRLGHPGRRPDRTSEPAEHVRPGITRLLEALDLWPAFVLGRHLDLLAWTSVGSALIGGLEGRPPEQRNLARLIFLNPGAQEYLADWEQVARETVGLLRLAVGRNPDDPAFAALVEELSLKRPDFRRWWADHEVATMTSGTRCWRHPVVGDLTLGYEALVLPDDSSQMLVIYTAEPGSRHARALRLLAQHAVPRPGPPATVG